MSSVCGLCAGLLGWANHMEKMMGHLLLGWAIHQFFVIWAKFATSLLGPIWPYKTCRCLLKETR